jgi:hypothetical protein
MGKWSCTNEEGCHSSSYYFQHCDLLGLLPPEAARRGRYTREAGIELMLEVKVSNTLV